MASFSAVVAACHHSGAKNGKKYSIIADAKTKLNFFKNFTNGEFTYVLDFYHWVDLLIPVSISL